MHSIERGTAPETGRICPTCHHPVTEKITRYKTMGIFVPLWKPGTCHNPICPKHAQGDESPRSSGAKP
ncbi:hypothetical protein LIV37_00495 [Streptomyces rapamycinicus NRRL 5491]|nr:hypothetical protein [Streptomyces rapamycinicus]UTP27995.1 hypothetical protein LIV37_00495 [Streptomyces rapamycinicus NRRL 5491]